MLPFQICRAFRPFFSVCLLAPSLVCAQQADVAAKIYARAAKSVLVILIKSADGQVVAQGTGFLVENGKIITNEHVIRGGTAVIDLGGVRIPATVESSDSINDLAVLTTSAELAAEPLVLSETRPTPGTSLFTIGNPRGLENSISTGVLAAVRQLGTRQLLQITTPISPGSSGGPVFDTSGKVVGVTVGTIEEGQNLNFAVPASAVIKLLHGQVESPQGDPHSLIEAAELLIAKRGELEYSADPDSPFMKMGEQIRSTLSTAVDRAAKDPDLLIRISNQFRERFYDTTTVDVAISAADRALRLKPSSDAGLALAKALNWKVAFGPEDDNKKELLERSVKAAKAAISFAKHPNSDMYYTLGDTLMQRESYNEADVALRHALEPNGTIINANEKANILRDLIVTAQNLQHPKDIDMWFAALVQTGTSSWWDWRQQAVRLDAAHRYAEAGQAWQQGAQLNKQAWSDWCEAAGSFALTTGNEDSVLFCARKCIGDGSGKKDSEARLSEAHREIAAVLNDRGVYEEALSHAKESTVLNPENAWAYDSQAVAVIGLHRNQEAINAEKQAIRLSDGKFGLMHFHLGYAYFETENWQFAKDSYEKAAQLMPEEDASAYNTALCYQHLGLFLDAAHWLEEALRRNPNRTDKQDILNRIVFLRGR